LGAGALIEFLGGLNRQKHTKNTKTLNCATQQSKAIQKQKTHENIKITFLDWRCIPNLKK
jgi:hypothetical protein